MASESSPSGNAAYTREQELLHALNAISGADGSWNTAAYAQDVLDGIYDGGPERYLLDESTVEVALGQLIRNRIAEEVRLAVRAE